MEEAQSLRVESPADFHRMPREYQELAIHQMTIHAAGELSGADDYVKWFYPMAPNARERRACCEFAVDEMNHYMRTARVLEDLGVDVSYLLEKQIEERAEYPSELVRGVKTWAERAMVSFLGESAVMEILIELGESSYRPFAGLFPRIIQEEERHIRHGRAIVEELCASEEGRARSQAALERFWPISLDLFGRSESTRCQQYRRWGLRRSTNEETRQRFIRKHTPEIVSLGLTPPNADLGRKFL